MRKKGEVMGGRIIKEGDNKMVQILLKKKEGQLIKGAINRETGIISGNTIL